VFELVTGVSATRALEEEAATKALKAAQREREKAHPAAALQVGFCRTRFVDMSALRCELGAVAHSYPLEYITLLCSRNLREKRESIPEVTSKHQRTPKSTLRQPTQQTRVKQAAHAKPNGFLLPVY
jgi:hypothetical protein